MITVRRSITSAIAALTLLPIAAEAGLSGEFKSQKWPGSKIVFFEDGTAWYHYPPHPTIKRPIPAHKLTFLEKTITLEGKQYHMVGLQTPNGSLFKGFLLIDGDLIEYGGDNDRFVKDNLWKRLTE